MQPFRKALLFFVAGAFIAACLANPVSFWLSSALPSRVVQVSAPGFDQVNFCLRNGFWGGLLAASVPLMAAYAVPERGLLRMQTLLLATGVLVATGVVFYLPTMVAKMTTPGTRMVYAIGEFSFAFPVICGISTVVVMALFVRLLNSYRLKQA